VAGDGSDDTRVQRFYDRAVISRADYHVARQQQPDGPVRRQGPVRQRRIAGAEDHVLLHLLAKLVPQRRLHINLGQHSEALSLQRLPDPGARLRQRRPGADGHRVHRPTFPRYGA